ncbi:hypothetical protein ABZ747_30675 [Kitasatospora cineracea]|uniref:hypothetical protein n=1 Tax=Kitasatospora cineracea TaxID=88074 RepID=UPI0033E8A0AF
MGRELRRWKLVGRIHRGVTAAVLVVMLVPQMGDGPGRLLPAAAGALVGAFVSDWLSAGYLAGPGRLFGLGSGGWTFGVGAPVRSSVGRRGLWQLRRIPLPALRPTSLTAGPALTPGRLVSALLLFLGTVVLGSQLLALAGGGFGRLAEATCLLGAVGPMLLTATVYAGPVGEPGDPAVWEVLSALQRDVAEGRRLLDALPPSTDAAATAEAVRSVLLAEGRYRELADLAQESAAGGNAVAVLLHARAPAYLDETGAADDADREAFAVLYAAARRLPRALRAGSDLEALHELALGRTGSAIDEARSAAAVGSVPLRRGMAYATLAPALHRAGRPEEARAALESARRTGPVTARLEFLTELVGTPAEV